MTFFEKWKEEHPGPHVGMGFPPDCPHMYGYEKPLDFNCDGMVCSECWSREMPEKPEKEKKVIYAHVGPFHEDYDKVSEFATLDTFIPNAAREAVGLPKITDEFNEIPNEQIVTPEETRHILDSGARREFGTGAVRDIQEGKGRCDLLPLDIVSEYLDAATACGQNMVLLRIDRFENTGDIRNLYEALAIFTEQHWDCNHTMLLEVSIHFEEGAKKYGENNWQKGIPVHCYIDSAVRHYLKFLRGDKDEYHDRAFAWNLICAIWTCKHKPELNDYAKHDISDAVKEMMD